MLKPVAILLLLATSLAGAALLRWARCPGWAVIGGVAAGLVLGPTIMGRVLPRQHAELLAGAAAERGALAEVTGRHGAERIAAGEAGFDDAQRATLARTQDEERAEAEARVREASWAHQRPMRWVAWALINLTMLGAGLAAPGATGRRPNVLGALSVGAWAVVLPGAVAWFCLRWLWDAGWVETALGTASVAVGPWALTAADRQAAEDAEQGGARLIREAGRIATVGGLGLMGVAICRANGAAGLYWWAPLAALIGGWLVPGGAAGRVLAVLEAAVVPAVAACVAVRVDLLADLDPWMAVLFLLLSGDGRWLGALTGAAILGGRRSLRTMRLVLGSMAAGPTQLAVTAAATWTWLIDGRLTVALMLGAVLIEILAPARRRMARRLVDTEQAMGD